MCRVSAVKNLMYVGRQPSNFLAPKYSKHNAFDKHCLGVIMADECG